MLHLALAAQHIHGELVRGVAGEQLPRLDERVVYGRLTVLRVPVLDEEVVDGLGDLGGAVEPADAHHQVVPLAALELRDEADVEGLVGPLALDEDAVARLVFDVLVVAAVAQVLPGVVLPGLPLARLAFSCVLRPRLTCFHVSVSDPHSFFTDSDPAILMNRYRSLPNSLLFRGHQK